LLIITKLVLTLVLVMLNEVEPTLVRVTFFSRAGGMITCVAYAREVGESLSFVPLPLSATLCGLPPALSEMVEASSHGRRRRPERQVDDAGDVGRKGSAASLRRDGNFELATMLEMSAWSRPCF